MLKEIFNYAKGLSSFMSTWKLDADAARKTYLKRAAKKAKSNRPKKSNRLHVSRKAKHSHRRR